MHGIHFIQDLAIILVVAGVVGWMCQRMGLSVVVGFLAAGMVVGPFTPPFSLVTDTARIETAAQVGLVFLMFGIGLRLSLRRLRRMGLALLLATFGGAVGVYYLTRLFGVVAGWNPTESLFLAAMLMTSSSAIISKVLQETGTAHERSGQMAMTITVMEDVVAVVMMTLLGSLAHLSGAAATGIGETLGLMGAFVALAVIGGLLFFPWLLRRMSIAADEELQTLGIAGLLFGMAILAHHAGYSLALGAFLLGTIVAETPHRTQVERTFEGMRDVFSAVFFVAIGMQINLQELAGSFGLIVSVAAFTLVARTVAITGALTLVGTPAKDALRTGMAVTPIGEFSFIIAQLGVAAAVVPQRFYPLAVGVSLLTTLVSPLLARNSSSIADAVLARQPVWLNDWLDYYRSWLERFQMQQKRSPLWQLSRKRFIQISVEMLFVSGLLLFSEQLFLALEGWLGRDWLFPYGPQVIFLTGLTLVVLAPLIAIWRNVSALALLYAQVTTSGHANAARLTPMVETGIKLVAGAGIFLWLMAVVPTEGTARWLLLGSALIAVLALLLLRQKLIFWHSHLEVELQSMMESTSTKMTSTTAPWLQPHAGWNLNVIDCMLPDLADNQGKKIAELDLRSRFGCSVVGIERQGFMISLPPPETVLYPRDRVLLLGTSEQVKAGKACLAAVSGLATADSLFEEVRMEALPVPRWSRAAGRTLMELSPAQTHGVQIAGISRGAQRILNPSGQETLQSGDEVLALGTPVQIREFKIWLSEE
ncbi:MAG: cation:proton antiporter, partial [Opitutaceae bacterium]|nr:cation:proton antiporter [Opitutaceae bacterium]